MTFRARILIVDDDPALLDALPRTIALRSPALEVHTSDSALRAVEMLEQSDYDLIVTDIKMPGMDGISLLQKIGSLRPDTPTVLISGHGEHDLTIQALRAGAYDFIQKPIDREYFMATIERALQSVELRRTVIEQQAKLSRQAQDLAVTVAERTRQLRLANEAKDEFLGLLSHEMRTPLTIINGGIQLIRSRGESLTKDAWDELLADMEREGDRLHRMVEDLFVLARAELDPGEAEPIALPRLAEKVVAQEMQRTGRTISVSTEDELPLVAGETTYVERVLTNLLSNADKYSEDGGEIEVDVRAQAGGMIEVSVLDRGPDLPEKEIEAIFERFYRSSANASRAKGAGMGLTVCKRLVEIMGGEIWADGRPGGGLIVRFTLPRYREPVTAGGANPSAEPGFEAASLPAY